MAKKRKRSQNNPEAPSQVRRTRERPRVDGGWFAALFGGLLVASLILLLFMAMVPWWNWLEARKWIETKATLTQTEEHLTYEYERSGQKYVQTTFSIQDPEEGTISPALGAFRQNHKPGDTVTVYVNPEDPGESVLDRSFAAVRDPKDFWIASAFCAVFFIPGLSCAIWGLKSMIGYVRDIARYKREAWS